MKAVFRSSLLALVGALLTLNVGTTMARAQPGRGVQAIQAETDIPQERLLDVGIEVFDPGIPEEKEKGDLEKKGIFAGVRKSEARFIPFQLKGTLEETGQWGAVRVVPTGTKTSDVTVSGQIIHSTGLELEVKIWIVDARGRVWRRHRTYKQEADEEAYDEEVIEQGDPYQDLYNEIANDMLAYRDRLRDEDIEEIHSVSRLRFGADLAPAVFDGYLHVNRKGRYSVERLPSSDDPMAERMGEIRDRDDMFIDTLNEFYADFHSRMQEHYDGWRQFSFEEELALRELRRKARRRKILGGLLIFAGVMGEASGGAAAAAGDAAIIGGVLVVEDGVQKGREAKIHVGAMQELAESFDAEITPELVRIEGKTLKLEGSAEAQFAEWRDLLHQLFTTETGLPLDPNADDDVAAGKPAVD